MSMCRDRGGGTLLSQVLERQKLSVKIPVLTESNENKRRLSNSGGIYRSHGGAGAKSVLGASILAPAATQASMQQSRLKGRSGGVMELVQGQCHSYAKGAELHDFSAVERLKELRVTLGPFLKQKPAATPPPAPALLPPSPHPEESVPPLLPHWGPGKRARRSRRDASKANGAAFPAKALPLRTDGEAASPLCTHGSRDSTLSFLGSDGNPIKAAHAGSRNGLTSRVAANGCTSTRQGITGAERALGSGTLTYRAEPSISLRQRSNSAAELLIVNNGGTGDRIVGSAYVVSRATTVSERASFHAKPRSEFQAVQWPPLLLGLSRKEKEDDFLILKGTKLPQRPKKRPKVVERALHFCMPGNALCDLSRGRYDVREKKSVKKRPRGLKGMESMESDSE